MRIAVIVLIQLRLPTGVCILLMKIGSCGPGMLSYNCNTNEAYSFVAFRKYADWIIQQSTAKVLIPILQSLHSLTTAMISALIGVLDRQLVNTWLQAEELW